MVLRDDPALDNYMAAWFPQGIANILMASEL